MRQRVLQSMATKFIKSEVDMCGIVAYIGRDNSVPVMIDGLKKLEYRGYDSAGIAYLNQDSTLKVKKAVGKLENLVYQLDENDSSYIGIGHTRWATHGKPSVENSHPHISQNKTIALVHNGIIENYLELKEMLQTKHGIHFNSDTDTEVVAHLIEVLYDEKIGLLETLKKAISMLRGAYALAVISSLESDKIVAVRKDSPLIIGKGQDANLLASDVPAIIKYTRNVFYINNDEFVELTKDSIKIFDKDLNVLDRKIQHVTFDVEAAEKGGYEHFTIKEIHEQEQSLKNTILGRLEADEINIEFNFKKEDLEKLEKIYIVACGTAYHAGLIGKHFIENIVDIPVQVEVASEFKYTKHFINKNSMFIAISQSGETLDTLHGLRKAKDEGAKILSILNVVGSSIARESDEVLYTWAGPEIGVASTKAYTTQLASLFLIGLKMAKILNRIDDNKYKHLLEEIKKLPELVSEVLKLEESVKKIAKEEYNNEKIFYIGRGQDYYSSLEASLKLKEISYINSFAIQAGELKHGTIALVEDGTFAIVFATQEDLLEKTLSNIKEVKARGAKVLSIILKENKDIERNSDNTLILQDIDPLLAPVLSIIPAQLLAYYISYYRGNDVDKPRNLAKSVTVE